jgi:anaerobic selenocysteine-containing dehydrogenase
MGTTRRDLLKFTGGAAAGLALTPVPWKLLRDTALVSENWPGVPQPLQGEVHTRYTTCTLCPAGCGVRARCIGDQPVSLAGVPGHATGHGTLCTYGIVGHHLAFCGGRVTRPLANGKPVSIEQALASVGAAIAQCGPRESVAILDARPGRAASQVYRRFLAGLANGIHCTPPDAQPYGPFGIDLENTRAILSFGVPVLDGWLSPGRVLGNRSHFQLIQVEATHSRTASLADQWVPIPPGEESDFAVAVARALKGESADARASAVARLLRANQPAIAIGAGAGNLNAVLGGVGRPGGFLRRRELAPATDIATVPDHSIRVLLLEESSLPWTLVQRKLVSQNAVVVALTPWLDGCARHADYVIPAPLYLESLDEAPTPAGSTVAGFSLSPALVAAPAKVMQPAEFILRLGHDSASYPDVLKQRVAELKKDNRGTVFTYADSKSTRVHDIATAADLWKTMLAGAAWVDDPMPQSSVGFPAPGPETGGPPLHSSPLMTKLYQESGLRLPGNAAVVNPETARVHGFKNGGRATVNGLGGGFAGQVAVQLIVDPAVMPGVVEVAGRAVSPASIRRA